MACWNLKLGSSECEILVKLNKNLIITLSSDDHQVLEVIMFVLIIFYAS
jgi:hypothetical protein